MQLYTLPAVKSCPLIGAPHGLLTHTDKYTDSLHTLGEQRRDNRWVTLQWSCLLLGDDTAGTDGTGHTKEREKGFL